MKTEKTFLQAVAYPLLSLFFSLLPVLTFAAEPNNIQGDIQASVVNSGIQLSWQKATNFDGSDVGQYRVYVDTHAVPDAEMYTEVQDTKSSEPSFTLTTFQGAPLKAGVTYYFAVTAVSQQGEESLNYSKEASVLFSSNAKTAQVKVSTTSQSADLLQMVSASATDKNTVEVLFNKEVMLPEKVEDAFTIQSENGEILLVKAMETKEDALMVTLTTADQKDLAQYTVTALSSISDLQKNPLVTGKMDSATFLGTSKEATEVLHGSAAPEEDTTPPEDVTGLKAKYSLNSEKSAYDVILSWIASKNTAGDIDHQLYYEKTGDTDYGTAISVEKDKTSYQKVLEGGKRYTFKISTVDASGNESTGAITSVILPETGPAAILGLAGLLSAGAAHLIRRKK